MASATKQLGELARTTARYRRDELGQSVHILDPWGCVTPKGDSFNPLDGLDPINEALADDAYAMAGLLIDHSGPLKEAYWDECAQALISGLIAHAVTSLAESDRSMRRVWQLAHGDDTIYDLAVLLDGPADVYPFARAQIAALLSLNADQTRACILSVVRQHLRLFGTDLVGRATATTSFDLGRIRTGSPTSLFIVVPPGKLRSHDALIRMWLSALMGVMSQRKSAPDAPTLLILDEVAQLGRIEQVTQAITLMRGYGLRCVLALQSYAQLRQLYPQEHEVLMENCGSIATFGHTALSMSRQLADSLGDISAEALFAMDRNELAIRRAGQPTRRVRRIDYLTDPEFQGRFDVDPLQQRQSGPSC